MKRLTATTEQVVTALQTQIDAAIGAGNVAASYDHASREFLFSPASSANTLSISVVSETNFLFGIKIGAPVSVGADGSYVSVGADGPYGKTVAPNGDFQRAEAEQRYGIKVIYDAATQAFSFSSGTTGNTSQVDVNFAVPNFNASTGVTTGDLDADGEIVLQANLPAAAFMGFEVTGLTDSKFSDTATGFNFSDAVVNGSFTHGQLKNFMSIDIDDSGAPVIIDFSELAEKKRPLTGREMADAIYHQTYENLGEKRFFDLSIAKDRNFALSFTGGGGTTTVNIDLGTAFTTNAAKISATTDQVVAGIQAQLDSGLGADKVTVSYDYASREFLFSVPSSAGSLSISSNQTNSLFGTSPTVLSVDANGSYGQIVTQNGDLEPTSGLPTYDLQVDYDTATETFSVLAEEDGAAASVKLSFHVPEYDMTTGSQTNAATADGTLVTQFNDKAASFMGVSDQTASTKTLKAELLSREALLSWSSKPAVARGGSIAPDLTRDIWVDPSNSFIRVNSDGVEGSFSLTGGVHSLDSLIIEIEKNINRLSSSDGRTISGVNVSYDPASNGLVFTTGTKGPDSYIEVSGSLTWGLKDVEPGRGFLTSSLADDIAGALQTVTAQRAEYGAMQNRLQYTISNLMNVSDNTIAARSRIEDADFATESAVLAKTQVLQQSGAAMLAQANARPTLVLQLIK